MKHVLTNKGHINSNEIISKKGNKTIIEGRELSETFNENYVNIAENTLGKKSTHDAHDNNIFGTDQGIKLIKQSFSDHSSISHIKFCLLTPNEI